MVLLFSLDNFFLEEIEDGKLPKRGGSSCKDELHVPVSLVLRRHLLVGDSSIRCRSWPEGPLQTFQAQFLI